MTAMTAIAVLRYMTAADCLVTKVRIARMPRFHALNAQEIHDLRQAGPGSIAEALIKGTWAPVCVCVCIPTHDQHLSLSADTLLQVCPAF